MIVKKKKLKGVKAKNVAVTKFKDIYGKRLRINDEIYVSENWGSGCKIFEATITRETACYVYYMIKSKGNYTGFKYKTKFPHERIIKK